MHSRFQPGHSSRHTLPILRVRFMNPKGMVFEAADSRYKLVTAKKLYRPELTQKLFLGFSHHNPAQFWEGGIQTHGKRENPKALPSY